MSTLNGKTFVLELGREIRFKAKQELINYLREQNAHISYILTASTDFVLVSNDIDTYKTRRAKQLGIPLVNVEYIYQSQKLSIGKEPIDIKQFLVVSAEDKENFSKSGTLPVSGSGSSSTISTKQIKYDLNKIKIWNSDDVELPIFDELTHAEIGKWAIFKETNENSDVYFALELQIIPDEHFDQTKNNYRLRFRYEKQTITSLKGKTTLIQYAFSNDIYELNQLFALYYYRIATMPRITRIRDLLPDKLGSKLLLRSLFLHRIDTQTLDDNVCQLIESLWCESIGDLNKILSIQPESIALKTIIEAEAALLEIKLNSKSSSEAETRFYSLIPHRQEFVVDLINDRHALVDKIDLCQMLRDLLTVNELTNWNIKASIEAKYRALKCHIETVKTDTQEYSAICDMVHSSTNANERVVIHQIYSTAKQTDALNFRSTLLNQKQLFHGSKYNHFLGILSRGLLMPKAVVDDLGITRTDFGCLGYGLYFSDSVSTSLKYTTPSTTRPGRRLLCISQVALGESAKYYSYAPNLTQPPENFHSTHGVKRNTENNSKFIDDEYAIYNLDQQRLLYIVEVSWIPFDDTNQPLNLLPVIRDYLTDRSITSTDEITVPSTIEDEVIQIAEQDYGLICPSSGQPVPLKAFHVRAQLVDVTAEVVLYQVYYNTSLTPIEAKYVFPLDENCSVCGFEAHINNKVIKGVVKEKEQAKREYREAIEKGHGAYLMHQEQPEVFSVSVGNLPANCEVIIKITYVAELAIENNDIVFRLPAKVASWQSKQALEAKDQTILPSINLEKNDSLMKSVEFSFKTSIRMPYEITKLFSPTHRLRRKITDCIAMIELVDNVLLEKDFILSITLKSVHLPRMLNETYSLLDNNQNQLIDKNSQACMLTFYPKFDIIENSNEFVEIIFIIDVSNSMDGKHVQQAKQLAHLFLTNMKTDNANIYFNIVTFGSDNDECFPISSPNTKENIDKAKHFVLHSLDHRGNTDLFSVLRQYSLLSSSSKLGRQFILLSDGHVNDFDSIKSLLENQLSMRHDRLFTCSIGDTPNKHNLKQLTNSAYGGGLTTIFDSDYRSKWKTKVLQILEHIRQPCITNISIDWHGTTDNQQEKFIGQAPKIIRSLFNGMRLTVYRFIQNCHKATLTATINNQEFVTTIFSNKITETKGRILHCLTARAIIQDYENGLLHNDESENELLKKQYKQDLIELSMKHSVVSSFTSFVAIEERDGQALQPGVRLLDIIRENDIDLLPYIGWDGDRSQIDLIKEKLINAKRLLDSASITDKLNLSNEYENLCQTISYRSGGNEKYDLMLAIIDSYETTLKNTNKARELEEKVLDDLINEMNNASADERQILEKRIDEISRLLEVKQIDRSDCLLEQDVDFCSDDLFSMASAVEWFADTLDDEKPLQNLECSKSGAIVHKTVESSDEDDMGFGLFDDYAPAKSNELMNQKQVANIPADMTQRIKLLLENRRSLIEEVADDNDDDDDYEEECDMSSGLFDDYVPAKPVEPKSLKKTGITLFEAEKESIKSFEKIGPQIEEYEEDECAMDFSLFGTEEYCHPSIMAITEKKKHYDEGEKESVETTTYKQPQLPILQKTETGKKEAKVSEVVRDRKQEKVLSKESSKKGKLFDTKETKDISRELSKPKPLVLSKPLSQTQQQQQEQQQLQPSLIETMSHVPTMKNKSNLMMIDNELDGKITPSKMQQWSPQISACDEQSPVAPPTIFTKEYINDCMADPCSAAMSISDNSASTASVVPATADHFYASSAPDLFSFGGSGMGGEYASSYSTQTNSIVYPTFSFGAPPAPPLPMTVSGFISPENNFNNNNKNLDFQNAAFGGSSSFSFGAPGVSMPPQSSDLFGKYNDSIVNNQPQFGSQLRYPPPPPPLISAGFHTQCAPSSLPSVPSAGFHTQFAPPPPPPRSSVPSAGFHTQFAPPPPPPGSFVPSAGFHPQFASPLPPPPFPSLPPQQVTGISHQRQTSRSRAAKKSARDIVTDIDTSTWAPPTSSIFDNLCSTTTSSSFVTPLSELNQAHPGYAPTSPSFKFSFAHQNTAGEQEPSVLLDISTLSPVGDSKQNMEPNKVVCDELPNLLKKSKKKIISIRNLAARFTDTRMDESEREIKISSATSNFNDNRQSSKKYVSEWYDKSESFTKVSDLLLLDVQPLDVGIEDVNGHMYTFIRRNTTIPTRTKSYPLFTNAYAYQTTATIRIFIGQHKLTKYNKFVSEFDLTGLTQNFASQTLRISVSMDIDANGVLTVIAEEPLSGAKNELKINSKDCSLSVKDIEQHLAYVESNADFRSISIHDQSETGVLYLLKGATEYSIINFTSDAETLKDVFKFDKIKTISLTTNIITALKNIQLTDGSFDLNQNLADLLSIDIKNFDELKKYLSKQGFNSFALNIQNDIIRLIATGIMLVEFLLQVPKSERNIFLVPFDSEQIRSHLWRHLPQNLLENVGRAIDFYQQKRLQYGIYCDQLELKYSSWEKFIQYSIFDISN